MTEINSLPSHWQVFNTAEDVAQTVTKELLKLAQKSIQKKGNFKLVTAGGTTPNRCYQLLSQQEADWSNWHIYMGDERCLPVDDPERNSVSLSQHWLKFGKISDENIHFIPAELGPELAAEAYQQLVKNIQFDAVLLGMGEDGHTASLFPGHSYADGASVVTERHSPKPPSNRISLSQKALGQSEYVFKLVTGKSKREAVKAWLKHQDLPIARVQGKNTLVYIDSEAL